MQIISNPHKDSATSSKPPGGYEWWYFDAIDESTGYALVVIFYQGNPFSNRYIRHLGNEKSGPAVPAEFPAISISLYKDRQPVFYSFTEYPAGETDFHKDKPFVRVGENSLEADFSGSEAAYSLVLNEELPSGDKVIAELMFRSELSLAENFGEQQGNNPRGHTWNLVMPRAKVEGSFSVYRNSHLTHSSRFNGLGYHDHNTGYEPMKDEFRDWYWGRYHFKSATLVYYVMNRRQTQQYRGWLIGEQGQVQHKFEDIELKDHGLSIFGLQIARKLVLNNSSVRVVIQQTYSLDNGPFYRRFMSEAFLAANDSFEKSTGFSEYIYPSRIYWKWLWPLVDMRIRYKQEDPHWVQKSGRLYRWTW
ncbi:MAG: hypothetical protein R3222_09825 [Balneolaceae bacterium]|nr:hypothetical protein [Balneolaceae bacterium]